MISIPECTDFDANFGYEPTINCCWGKLYVTRRSWQWMGDRPGTPEQIALTLEKNSRRLRKP
ncbi:hypothetical protein [Microcoleus sp. S13_C5]|uniref:hypothetical protein n=1 Tax=Microcoleus sp. S13_C5 TaxID=3055411 RepID=UPI002FD0DA39